MVAQQYFIRTQCMLFGGFDDLLGTSLFHQKL